MKQGLKQPIRLESQSYVFRFKVPALSFLTKAEQVFQSLDAVGNYLKNVRRRINESRGGTDAFVTAVIAASDYEEMDQFIKKSRHESPLERRALPQPKEDLIALKDQLVEIAVQIARSGQYGWLLVRSWWITSPSQVNHRFGSHTVGQGRRDCWFLWASPCNDYIKVEAIAQKYCLWGRNSVLLKSPLIC